MEELISSIFQIPKNSYTGIINLYNICYLNSVIQVLLHNKYFYKWVLRTKKKGKRNGGDELIDSFINLLIELSNITEIPIEPKTFRAKIADKFPSTEQHDSHEFLLFLFDKIHEYDKKKYVEPISQFSSVFFKQAKKEWNEVFKGYKSVITELFYGQFFTTFTCSNSNCYNKTYKFDLFNNIPLNPDKEKISMKNMVNNFFKKNLIDKKCEKCNETKCIERTKIFTLPKILIFVVKRIDKTNTDISGIFEELDFSKYIYTNTYESVCYRLNSTVCHQRIDIDSGHYTSYIKTVPTYKLHYFDDNVNYPVNKEDIPLSDVYLLFYEQI